LATVGTVNFTAGPGWSRAPASSLHFNVGLIYGRQGWWEEAAIEYQQALASNPDLVPARQQLAAARAHLAKRNR